MMTKYFGTVTRDFHRNASYVRVNIPQYNRLGPLSIKVLPGDFDRKLFKKDRVVAVDDSCSVIVEVYDNFEDTFRGCCDKNPRKIRFWVGSRYFDTGENFHRLMDAIDDSLGDRAKQLAHNAIVIEGVRGFYVVCWEDQFAAFLIARNAVGLSNGFMDLEAKYVDPAPNREKEIDVSGY